MRKRQYCLYIDMDSIHTIHFSNFVLWKKYIFLGKFKFLICNICIKIIKQIIDTINIINRNGLYPLVQKNTIKKAFSGAWANTLNRFGKFCEKNAHFPARLPI